MDKFILYVKNILDYIVGWIEVAKYKSDNYKYTIERIELKEEDHRLSTIIRYKLIGCRTPMLGSAYDLNNSYLFSLFRPDHAQLIVSIATVESLLDHQPDEIRDKYLRYISQCSLKIRERVRC